ncbi:MULTISPECIES: hypothetical protein [Aestuariibaculum]|uniref:STAS/SEC14 domain-containing protein n=1 Tax=Aestuariibaculum lutulentum TaxID=2920935 RepID=A0ABS9REU4_9FLAO|nr:MULTISPECIES: hypothetical protein [Aestuariibaculum]MCH4551473.1 hypothetical protein [Aestuariibaculum lutulentum]MCR8666572.1 hypothetical protein [Aestuariibaculum sp. M13]
MKGYRLSFGEIIIHNNSLAEVIVDEGEIMCELKVDEYHDFLLSSLVAPFKLLINKINSYSYTFEAQKIVGNLKEIAAMAVVISSQAGLMSTETLMSVGNSSDWNIKLFRGRDAALYWLESVDVNANVVVL